LCANVLRRGHSVRSEMQMAPSGECRVHWTLPENWLTRQAVCSQLTSALNFINCEANLCRLWSAREKSQRWQTSMSSICGRLSATSTSAGQRPPWATQKTASTRCSAESVATCPLAASCGAPAFLVCWLNDWAKPDELKKALAPSQRL